MIHLIQMLKQRVLVMKICIRTYGMTIMFVCRVQNNIDMSVRKRLVLHSYYFLSIKSDKTLIWPIIQEELRQLQSKCHNQKFKFKDLKVMTKE